MPFKANAARRHRIEPAPPDLGASGRWLAEHGQATSQASEAS